MFVNNEQREIEKIERILFMRRNRIGKREKRKQQQNNNIRRKRENIKVFYVTRRVRKP